MEDINILAVLCGAGFLALIATIVVLAGYFGRSAGSSIVSGLEKRAGRGAAALLLGILLLVGSVVCLGSYGTGILTMLMPSLLVPLPSPTPTMAAWEQVEFVTQSSPGAAARLVIRALFEADDGWRTPFREGDQAHAGEIASRIVLEETMPDGVASQVLTCLQGRGITVTQEVRRPLDLFLHIHHAECFERAYTTEVVEDQGEITCGLPERHVVQWYVGEHELHDEGTEFWAGGWVFAVVKHEKDPVLLDAYKVEGLLLAEGQGP